MNSLVYPNTKDRRNDPNVTVIGAGLAGSLLATFLARRGMRVTVFERRPDLRRMERFSGRSINLALANRGIDALERVGVMDQVRPLLIPMRGRMLHHEDGSLQLLPYGRRPEEVIYSVSRAGLNAILMDAAEGTGNVSIEFDRTCRTVDFAKREVELTIPGGSHRRGFHVLFGTDGSSSPVRSAILDQTGGDFHDEPLGHSYKELSIPPSHDGGFRMEQHALHIWPRGEYMLIALPNPDGSFTVTLFLPNRGEESFESLERPEEVRSLFHRRFPDAVSLIPHLEREFFENPTGHLETIRCWPWHYGSLALILGDAAHAIVPFHGQGMNAAFEDCREIDDQIARGHSSWGEVFSEFARSRKSNAEAIADMALENYIEMRSSVRDPKFQLRKALAFQLEERHPERFIPRYSMVMFHLLPYAEARNRGRLQGAILDELTLGKDSLAEVDLELADRLIRERLDRISEHR